MMAFLRAHGLDAGPLQRPLLAGSIAGLVATVPAGAVFVALGSFAAADAVLRLPRPAAAAVLVAAFTGSGAATTGLGATTTGSAAASRSCWAR